MIVLEGTKYFKILIHLDWENQMITKSILEHKRVFHIKDQ
jgi:hypothetical protein